MHLRQPETGSGGAVSPALSPRPPVTNFKKVSSSLPLGQLTPIAKISGPTYVTAQLLIQQVAYKLSDKIFSFSPETFDLDVAAKDWADRKETNIHGYPTTVVPLQTRSGAGTFALGYIFSKDFDLSKRHIPQTLLAPSLSLRHLRSALDQLSLLYSVASPFVAHIAAADYSATNGFITDYDGALTLAEDLGLGLVSSSSAYETQHMALLSTLMANILPTLHIYDGVRTSRETLRVVDALAGPGISDIYTRISKEVSSLNKRLDSAGKVVELLTAFNNELGTEYELFEYHGHDAPDTVLVVFGSVEAQLANQVISGLADKGVKIGAINVRVYRPFVEEAFLKAIPDSVQQVAVLGQVRDEHLVDDASVQSALYSDVLAAVSFSSKWEQGPSVADVKYAAAKEFTPASFASLVLKTLGKDSDAQPEFHLSQLEKAQEYIFWDADDSATADSPAVVSSLISRESTNNVYVHEVHDNLVQGGVIRTDIRSSKKVIEAPYAIEEADVSIVCEEKILKDISVTKSVKRGGKLLLRLPNFKEEDAEKRIPPAVRRDILEKALELYVLDSSFSPAFEKDARILIELVFLSIIKPGVSAEELTRLVVAEEKEPTLQECVDGLGQCLRRLAVPDSWAELPADFVAPSTKPSINCNSFTPFQREEPEEELEVRDWQSAAKGLAFKEAYGTKTALRPEQTVKTHTIHVKENRRLTPDTYDRNIFHIEFDLGDSGLTYNIGEALGIHAENDPALVQEFITAYGLDAGELVQVPSREDAGLLETRTVYQSLVQNLDILGKPPKRFYESLAEFATDAAEQGKLTELAGAAGADEFKRRSELDMVTYADVLAEFPSARPRLHELARIVAPLKRREYSIASAQAVTPRSVALMIVVVDWVDTRGRTRTGHATRYLSRLPVGAAVTVSVKPSVMKLPARDEAPLIMAGLGTGLAPFRAFVQYRAMQKAAGREVGEILLYLGSRHQREEYLYGEEWEAYLDAGVVTLLGAAFSRDQPRKIYIQDRMRQTMRDIVRAYIEKEGSFYLCGPTWPVPDVTAVLQEAIATEAKASGRKVDSRKEIERLKEEGRYVLEVY